MLSNISWYSFHKRWIDFKFDCSIDIQLSYFAAEAQINEYPHHLETPCKGSSEGLNPHGLITVHNWSQEMEAKWAIVMHVQ